MKTYIVSATCGFDWLHFLVKGESFEDAKQKVEKTFTEFNVYFRSYDYINQTIAEGKTDIVDFYVDEDDIEYGQQYFELCDYEMEFVVEEPDGTQVEFTTQEEALAFITENFPNVPYKIFKSRAYHYWLEKK